MRSSFAAAALASTAKFNPGTASSPRWVVIFIDVVGCGTGSRTETGKTVAGEWNRPPPGTTTHGRARTGTSETSTADRPPSVSTGHRSGHRNTRRTARKTPDHPTAPTQLDRQHPQLCPQNQIPTSVSGGPTVGGGTSGALPGCGRLGLYHRAGLGGKWRSGHVRLSVRAPSHRAISHPPTPHRNR